MAHTAGAASVSQNDYGLPASSKHAVLRSFPLLLVNSVSPTSGTSGTLHHQTITPPRKAKQGRDEANARQGEPMSRYAPGGTCGPGRPREAIQRLQLQRGGLVHKGIFWAGIGGCVRIGGPAPCMAGPGAARATVSGVVRAERRCGGGRAGGAGRGVRRTEAAGVWRERWRSAMQVPRRGHG